MSSIYIYQSKYALDCFFMSININYWKRSVDNFYTKYNLRVFKKPFYGTV